MLTSSAPRADTFGATSGATTSGTFRPRIRSAQLSKWTQFFFFQRSYGWTRLTQPGARPFHGVPRRLKAVDGFVFSFPRSQDEDLIFRMQRYASLNPCDVLSHRCDTGTRVWQYEGSTSVEDHDVAFVNRS